MDRRYFPIFLVLVIMGFLFIFTLIFPGMIIYDLVLALMCYIMYFTIENPDLTMQKEIEKRAAANNVTAKQQEAGER